MIKPTKPKTPPAPDARGIYTETAALSIRQERVDIRRRLEDIKEAKQNEKLYA